MHAILYPNRDSCAKLIATHMLCTSIHVCAKINFTDKLTKCSSVKLKRTPPNVVACVTLAKKMKMIEAII